MSRSLIAELGRRGVFRVAAAYAAVAWLLVQVAETLLPLYGFGNPAVRAVVAILVIGFVPAVILAWVFEWTPGGIRVDAGTAERTTHKSKWLDRSIVTVLVIAVVYFAVDKFVINSGKPPSATFGETSLAVCPFENLSPDPEQDYFATGVAEELLNLLARVPQLRVISRTSSFELCGRGLGITEIAERLDVTHVLEGSVRKTGNRLRVTAQLIEGPTDAHIWSDTWDRDLGDVFDIQDEIAGEVVSRLEVLLVQGMPRSERTDPLAYALTLQARKLQEPNTIDNQRRAVGLLQQALELDPDYVTALLALNVQAWGLREMEMQDVEEMALLERETYQRLVEIAPDDPRVVARQAWNKFEIEHDWQGAARLMERAINLAPGNITAVTWAGAFAYVIGRFDKSLEILHRALSIDPLCVDCAYFIMRVTYYAKDYDRVAEAYRQFRDLGGKGGIHTLGKAQLLGGQPEKALETFSGAPGGHADRSGQVMALHDLGRREEARLLFERLQESPDGEVSFNIAEAAAWIGDADAAFLWLEEEHGSDDYRHFFMNINDPVFERLHDDPRWQALARKVNLSDAQRAAIEFDPHLPH